MSGGPRCFLDACGQPVLGDLADWLARDVTVIEGVLADDFEPIELVEMFGPDAIDIGESLRWPNTRDHRSRILVAGPDTLAGALRRYPTGDEWTYERGLIRDMQALNGHGFELWSLDSGSGVVSVTGRAIDLLEEIRTRGLGVFGN